MVDNEPVTTISQDKSAAGGAPWPLHGPLTAEAREALAAANRRAAKVLRAAKIAAFNGWTIGVFAVLCVPFALFSITALVMAVGLGVVSYNEFRGRRLIRQFDLRGPRLLGWNQVGFVSLIACYCLWQIFRALIGPGHYAADLAQHPELATLVGPYEDLIKYFTLLVYATVLTLTAILQGFNALYYFTRRKHLQAYLDQTEGWIIELQRFSSAA